MIVQSIRFGRVPYCFGRNYNLLANELLYMCATSVSGSSVAFIREWKTSLRGDVSDIMDDMRWIADKMRLDRCADVRM